MEIKSAKYLKIGETNAAIKVTIPKTDVAEEKELFVPIDPNNSDYAEIMRQVEAGDLTIAAAD
jgi:hypothetical protein